MSKLPVTIVTGYLGAGKTTLVNALLSQEHGRRITVLVNDFGEVAIDEDLIVARDGDTIALANGCMCCSLGDDLFASLDRILSSATLPDHLVIETSGVADPGRLSQIALAEPMLDHRGTVTVVDPVNIAASLADPVLADTICRQLAAASLIVVSKADLCDAAGLSAAETLWRPYTPPNTGCVVVAEGGIAAEVLLGEFDVPADTVRAPVPHGHHHHSYRSWTRTMPAPVSRSALEKLLARQDLGIFRLKGFVRIEDGSIAVVQKAGSHWTIAPHDQAGRPPALRIVAIGRSDALDIAGAEAACAAMCSATA
ncbi:GTP-binding protein [Aliihoeflea aestuarii]|uniref:CobW family GTP-binding protein n=1 Tax=Aliihoeflea aestuarii TaxID=453840 RepID=UPI002092AEA7|nr:GTP-binding protein [Aliihoeflea aestuarii]MCO6390114.1 GTP-binding protein [Aliihoeflea aestuarii]